MSRTIAASLLVVASLSSSLAQAKEMVPVEVVMVGQEKILADENGKSLYTFDKDQPGKSDCTGICAAIWPPLVAAEGAKASGQWSLVRRHDGSMQWAFNGSPLYTYRLDTRPGDVSGDGAEGVWHVARP